MIVTKIGVIPADKIWEGECSSCKSTIEAVVSELTRTYETATAVCPICNNVVYFYQTTKVNHAAEARVTNTVTSIKDDAQWRDH